MQDIESQRKEFVKTVRKKNETIIQNCNYISYYTEFL